MTLGRFASQEGVEVTADGYLHLKKDSTVLTVPAGKDHTVIVFAMNEYSGSVEIDRDGDRRLYDLYAEQPQDKWVECGKEIFAPGDFTAKVNLPRYDIHRLQIEAPEGLQAFHLDAVTILSQKGEVRPAGAGRGIVFQPLFFGDSQEYEAIFSADSFPSADCLCSPQRRYHSFPHQVRTDKGRDKKSAVGEETLSLLADVHGWRLLFWRLASDLLARSFHDRFRPYLVGGKTTRVFSP